MNNAGNALLSNSGSSVLNSAANSVSQTFGTFGTWILVAGILLLLTLAYMLYQNQIVLSQLLPTETEPRDWRELQRREARQERKENAGFGENWCFVGEDVTGRWCVKVPRPDACSPERLFSSRPGCELVAASPLPLGLVAKGGAVNNPLLAAVHTK